MTLKNLIAEYIPVGDDPVDLALADYIDGQGGKTELRILFIRVRPWIYYFGSKKISVRLAKDTIMIHFGGRSMPIEQFLQ